jgi:hypothetical protein
LTEKFLHVKSSFFLFVLSFSTKRKIFHLSLW